MVYKRGGGIVIFDMTKRKGGGYTADDWFDLSKPVGVAASDLSSISGAYLLYGRSGITELNLPNCTRMINETMFQSMSGLTKINAPLLKDIPHNEFKTCTNLEYIVFPKGRYVGNSSFASCSKLKAADFGGAPETSSVGLVGFGGTSSFSQTALNILVLRNARANGTSPWALSNINVFNNTPFSSGGTGGTLYVPASLIPAYESATNWSTILGYPNNQIKSIESTHTDPNAPVDLTLYYVDGTPIPTT